MSLIDDSLAIMMKSGDGGAEIITRSDWDALTTAQKQAKGLVAIQDSTTGFQRGVLVNGADYISRGVYIPYSTEANVMCEATIANFNSLEDHWGIGNWPLYYTQTTREVVYNSSEDAIYLSPRENKGTVYCTKDTNYFTAYIVAKLYDLADRYSRILCCCSEGAITNGSILLNGNPVWISSWSNDTETSVNSVNQYIVGCIRYGGTQHSKGFVLDPSTGLITSAEKPVSTAQNNIVIGQSFKNGGSENRPTSLYVRYFAAVNIDEDDAVIEANMQNLYNEFIAV